MIFFFFQGIPLIRDRSKNGHVVTSGDRNVQKLGRRVKDETTVKGEYGWDGGSKTPVKSEWGRVKGSRVQRPCKVNADETQTRTRKYNETSFLFLIFFIGSSSARAQAFCYAVVKMRQNPSKSIKFAVNGVWVVPSRRRFPRNEA